MTGEASPLSKYIPQHFSLKIEDRVAIVTLTRPDKKNPLTFESYRELYELFHKAYDDEGVSVFVLTGDGGNFCSGGDVYEIIEPLLTRDVKGTLNFTRLTGNLVKAMRACPQPIIAAVDGVCAGAGAILAMASDMRVGTPLARVAFLFNRVGLAGCDMGACAMLPRIVGLGRASELLFLGRSMGGEEGLNWGFFNRVVTPDMLMKTARDLATDITNGPSFAHAMTKRMLTAEWSMGLEAAIDAETIAQALCMRTEDFKRAFDAFVSRKKPEFLGK